MLTQVYNCCWPTTDGYGATWHVYAHTVWADPQACPAGVHATLLKKKKLVLFTRPCWASLTSKGLSSGETSAHTDQSDLRATGDQCLLFRSLARPSVWFLQQPYLCFAHLSPTCLLWNGTVNVSDGDKSRWTSIPSFVLCLFCYPSLTLLLSLSPSLGGEQGPVFI